MAMDSSPMQIILGSTPLHVHNVVYRYNRVCSSVFTLCIPTDDLQCRLRSLIVSDSNLHRAVLLYQPLWLHDLKLLVTQHCIKCSSAQLVNFLDNQVSWYTYKLFILLFTIVVINGYALRNNLFLIPKSVFLHKW